MGLIAFLRGPQGVPGPQGPGMSYYFARKTAIESVASSVALQNDDHLFCPIPANSTWIFKFHVLWVAIKKGDIKLDITVPSGATCYWYQATDPTTFLIPPAAVTANGDSSQHLLTLEGFVRTGSTAGSLQLRWAQNGSQATPTQVLVDSTLLAQRTV